MLHRLSGIVALLVVVLGALACAPADKAASAPTVSVTSPTRGPAAGSSQPGSSQPGDGAADITPIAWEACGAGVECGTLSVPRDWDRPDAERLDLALARRPATGPGDRIGSLFFNPGGPGAAGTAYVQAGSLDATLNERFDIVSWDPRGVGDSAAVICDDHTVAYRVLDWSPDDSTEQEQLDATARAIASACAEANRDEIGAVDSDATARDLDALRAAVGDDRLTFIGLSYGTYIGLRYADLFPTRVRAMVLDGVVDPTEDLEGLLVGQTQALETQVDAMFASCAPPGCPVTDAAATYDRVARRVESSSLPAGNGAVVGPTALAFAAISASYDARGRDTFLSALAAADAGDGTDLRALADGYWSAGSFTSYLAILCTDNPHPIGSESHQALSRNLQEISPRFGAAMANEVLPCAFWDAPAPDAPHGAVRAPGAAPILVVGNTGDVATPIASARRVADDLESGVLLTYAGRGHTSFGKSACVDDTIRTYFIDLTAPAPSSSC